MCDISQLWYDYSMKKPAKPPIKQHVAKDVKTVKPKTGSRKKIQVRAKDGTYSVKLTRKQKAFADGIINNPKASAAEIARQTYNITDNKTSAVVASQNLSKTNISLYIDEHVNKAKERIVQLIDSDKPEIQLRASQDILDRTHGKAKQQIEQVTTGVTLNIDLTGQGVSTED